jgi:DNA-binding GntR family transcriptional regulator
MATNLKRSAYEYIRQNLLCGKLTSGTFLSPVALAKELGISHTPVREAISQLESEGLIEMLPRLGARIKLIDRQELTELFEVREILESGAAVLAAERISEEQLDSMRQLEEQYADLARQYTEAEEDGDDPDVLIERLTIVDVAFHLQLLSASGNRRMRKIVGDLHLLTHLFHYPRPKIHGSPAFAKRITDSANEHRRLVHALEHHDPQASAEAVRQHIRGSKYHQLEMFDSMGRIAADSSDDAAWPEHVLRLISQMEQQTKPSLGQRSHASK